MRFFSSSVAMLALLAAPALAQDADAGVDPTQLIAPAEAIELDPGAEAGEQPGQNRFVLTFEASDSSEIGLIREKFIRDGIIADVLDELSDQIALPADFPITFKKCDKVNAWFSPADRAITFCYELVQLFNHGYDTSSGPIKHLAGWADQGLVLTGTTLHVLLHEIGHAMVEIFELPITGKEEDAVDQFATLTLIAQDEEGDALEDRPSRLALLGALMHQSMSVDGEKITSHYLSDVHSLGQQRFYDTLCLVVGSNDEVYFPIIAPGAAMVSKTYAEDPSAFDPEKLKAWLRMTDDLNLLPQARLFGCEYEFKRYDASWDFLVENFMKRQAD